AEATGRGLASPRRQTTDLASRRADGGARRPVGGRAWRRHRRPRHRGRDRPCGDAPEDARFRDQDSPARNEELSAFLAIVRDTVRLSYRVGGGALVGVLFFLSVLVVIPFGVGPDLNLLARIGPAVLWIGALLATLL